MALMGLTTLFMIALSLSFFIHYGVRGRSISKEDLELERKLKKTPIKTIQTEGGVFDCVDINKQPAFDHPLLKNHKIQMEPTSNPNGLIAGALSVDKHPWDTLNKINCPQGTVPIRRTLKEDLIRAKSFPANNLHPQTTNFPGQHLAILKVSNYENKRYNGVHAFINIYNMTVGADQSTSSQVWIENGPSDQLNTLQAGWIVSPPLFDDNLTRLFGYWSVHGGKSGCFNTFCSGFIQVDKNLALGDSITPTSTYNGPQFAIHVLVFQDSVTGNWWLKVHEKNVGYWPKSLLPHLVEGASLIAWGGLVKGPPNEASAPMGNGHFPKNSFHRACYFRQIKMINASNYLVNPSERSLETVLDCPKGYNIQYKGYIDKVWEHSFLFGGPGGSCGV